MPTPNVRLRSRRERVPLSQAELAEQVGVAVTSVRRWEAGWRPQPEHVRRLCAVLDATPAQLGLGLEERDAPGPPEPALDALLSELPDRVVVDTRTLLKALGAATPDQRPSWLASAIDLRSERTIESRGRHPETTRRQLDAALEYHADMEGTVVALSVLVGTDLGSNDGVTPFSMAALARASRDWLVDLQRRPNLESRPSEPVARAIRDTFRAFQELDTRYGGGHARLALVQYLAAGVLPELTVGNRDVQDAGAELLYLAGLMAFDDGALGLAERYLIQSLRLAEEAGSRAFAANVVAAMSHLAVFTGDGHEAIRLARAGLAGMRATESPPVRMRLLSMGARGRAITGDSVGCASDLSDAEHALEEATSDVADWARFLNRAFLAGEMSQCFRDLHQGHQAERHALESIRASSGRGRRRVLSQATLAISYLQQGDLERACAAGGQAIDLLEGGIRSTRALHEIRCLARGLESYGTHPEVRTFRDRVNERLR